MTESSLLIKYRPNTWDEVVGQAAVVDSLVSNLEHKRAHAYMFVGPSGSGKTTLALLAAKYLKCEVEDIDAATYTGVDDMRAIAAALMYRPLGAVGKAIILDEMHMLSKNAVTSLLKVVEKPPEWGYWFFCTTEPIKIPVATKTRCITYQLKPVSSRDLISLLSEINAAEKLKVHSDVISVCAREANGSPRQAISNLVACVTAKTQEEAGELLASGAAGEAPQAVELARALYRGAKWPELQGLVKKLQGTSTESIRQVVRAYGTTVALSAPKEDAAGRAVEILDAFSVPFNSHDGITPVLIACAKVALS